MGELTATTTPLQHRTAPGPAVRRLLLACGILGVLALTSMLFASPAFADLPVGHDQAGWDRTAATARSWLSAAPARQRALTDEQWDDLRLTLTVERELALEKAQQESLDTRIVRAEIAELGPGPVAGAREAPWIASRRSQLDAALAEAERPMMAARDAHARAGVLIADVNAVIDRQTRAELFGRVPSVLGPTFWRGFAGDVRSLSKRGVAAPPGIPSPAPVGPYLLASIGAGLLAVLAAIFAHRWVFALEGRGKPSPRGHLGFAFLKDLADIVLPMLVVLLALALLEGAADRLAIPPGIEVAVITAGAIAIYIHWLGRSVFRPAFEPGRLIALPQGPAKRAVFVATALGLILAFDSLVDYAQGLHSMPAAFITLAWLVVAVSASLCLWTLTRIVRANRPAAGAAPTSATASRSAPDLMMPLSRLLLFTSLAAPLLALAGYVVLARDLLTAAIYSVAAICVALFLFRSITRACDILFDRLAFRASRSWQFVPLVFGFVLVLLTVPIVMTLWGVRFATILDGVLALKDGVQVGQVHVSFGSALTFGVVFLIGYFLTRWTQRIVQLALFPRVGIDAGARAAVLTAVGYIGLTISALAAVTAAGLDLSSLAVVAGALSVGIGFGLQPIVSNFVSGLILLVERPVKEGDTIEVGAVSGHVRRIAFRSTHVETFDRHEVIIPNSDLISGSVTNLTYGGSEGRISLPVGVAYGTDIEKAKDALLAIARDHAGVMSSPAPAVTMNGFGESAVELTLLCFVKDVNDRGIVRSDLYFAVLKAFAQQEIEVPFPQREIRLHRPRAAPPGGEPAGA